MRRSPAAHQADEGSDHLQVFARSDAEKERMPPASPIHRARTGGRPTEDDRESLRRRLAFSLAVAQPAQTPENDRRRAVEPLAIRACPYSWTRIETNTHATHSATMGRL